MIGGKAHVEAFLAALHPNPSATAVVQFVALRGREAESLWLWDRAQAVDEVLDYNRNGWHCYVGVQARLSMSGGERENIAGMRALCIDIDTKKTGVRIEDVCAYLEAHELSPSATVASGNGGHAYWLLGELATLDEGERQNKRLCALTHSDAVWNASRIMRLPGTVNWKDPPTICYLRSLGPKRWALPEIAARLDRLGVPNEPTKRYTLEPLGEVPAGLDVLVASLPDETREIVITGKATGYPSNSEVDWAVTCALVSAGATDAQITAVFAAYPVGMLKVRTAPASYLARTIGRAREDLQVSLAARRTGLQLPVPPFFEVAQGRYLIHQTEDYRANMFWR